MARDQKYKDDHQNHFVVDMNNSNTFHENPYNSY